MISPSPASRRNQTDGLSVRLRRSHRSLLTMLALCWMGFTAIDFVTAQTPTITVRFANPTYNCSTSLYCVDVQMKSSLANTEVFGMNVRFFYDDAVLEFNSYSNWQGGYGVASPNPPVITTSSSFGPNMGFTGAAEYFNGGMEKVVSSAPPIYLSTSGWTTLYSLCFTVDAGYPSNANFCPPLVWDIEANPTCGGYFNDGVVITVIQSSGGTGPSNENVDQFNWDYNGSNNYPCNSPPAPPYGDPFEESCIDITCGGGCETIVTSTQDNGSGTLRDIIACAPAGSTITFAASLAGQTINLTSGQILINKNLNIFNTNATRVNISTTSQQQLFEIQAGKTVHFKFLNITSGTGENGSSNNGAAFENYGLLRLENVDVFRNVNLPSTKYVVRNFSGAQFRQTGANKIRN